ncbi:MAG: IclR family transcriptional regulator [Rhodospirillales bacterium]
MPVDTTEQAYKLPERHSSSALFVGSLEKGFRVLAAFGDDFPSLGVTEIALRTGLDKSAAQRFSNTLHQLGFLEKDAATRRYRPARKLMEMAYTYLRHSALGAVAMPRLIEAGGVYKTTMNLAERHDTDMIYTVRIPHEKAAYAATVPGRRVPAFCTATGQAVLSRLSDTEVNDIIDRSDRFKRLPGTTIDIDKIHAAINRTRKQGYAITYEQLLPREIGVAAPIVDYRGRPIAAVHIPAYTPNWSLAEARDKLGPLAIETADAISGALVASEQDY